MADPFGVAGGAHGSDPFGVSHGGGAPHHAGGVVGFLGNALHDAENTLSSVPAAFAHPLRTVENIPKTYAQAYGPLVHGDFHEFLHQVYEHPLGYALDASALLTGGAGLVAHGGEMAADAGLLGRDSALANLRTPIREGEAASLARPGEIQVPAPNGDMTGLRMSSRNPAIRTRELLLNHLMNALPAQTRLVGSIARWGRAMVKAGMADPATFKPLIGAWRDSWAKLSNSERVAFHNISRGVGPEEWLRALKAGEATPEMTKALSNPDVLKAFKSYKGNPKLLGALAKGKALSDAMTAKKNELGLLDEDTSAARNYLNARRVMFGAEKVGENHAALGDIHSQLNEMESLLNRSKDAKVKLHYQDAINKLKAKAEPFQQERDQQIEAVRQHLESKGMPQPFYIPDRADVAPDGADLGMMAKPGKAGNIADPTRLNLRANRGVLFHRAISLYSDPLSKNGIDLYRYLFRNDIHQMVVNHAVAADRLLPGMTFLKRKAWERLPYTERAAANTAIREHGPLSAFFSSKDMGEAAKDAAGKYLQYPKQLDEYINSLFGEARYGKLNKLLYRSPTTIWKYLVLGLRPAYFANLTVGNHVLAALQMAGLHGVTSYLNNLPGLTKGRLLGSWLTDETMASTMPEQLQTFAESQGLARDATTRLRRLARQALLGVMPAQMKMEQFLRRAMAEGWARATPEVRDALKQTGGDINKALLKVAGEPNGRLILRDISKRVDDAIGDYRTYHPVEERIRQVIPFYAWDRHIARSVGRILKDRPGTADALYRLGQQGQAQQQQWFGALPTYLQGLISLGGDNVVNTHSLWPLSSAADLTRTGEALVSGRAGTAQGDLTSTLNPILSAGIEQATGRSLLTGSPLKDKLPFGMGNVPIRAVLDLPQARLLEAALGKHPLGESKHPVLSDDARSQLAALLGVPYRKLNKANANAVAAKEGQPPH